jgi:hypothetical protein
MAPKTATKRDLEDWVYHTLALYSGRAKIVDVARDIWARHEAELRASGDLFYTWQHDIRWAAQRLRAKGKLAPAGETPRGVWAVNR